VGFVTGTPLRRCISGHKIRQTCLKYAMEREVCPICGIYVSEFAGSADPARSAAAWRSQRRARCRCGGRARFQGDLPRCRPYGVVTVQPAPERLAFPLRFSAPHPGSSPVPPAFLASLIIVLVIERCGVTGDDSQARRRPPLLPRGSRSRRRPGEDRAL